MSQAYVIVHTAITCDRINLKACRKRPGGLMNCFYITSLREQHEAFTVSIRVQ